MKNVKKIAVAAFGICVLSAPFASKAEESGYRTEIYWGVRPFEGDWSNGTVFRKETGAEWEVSKFNENCVMRLAYVADGSFDEQNGFGILRWLDAPATARSTEEFLGADTVAEFPDIVKGHFTVSKTSSLPIEYFGDIDELDPDGDLYGGYEDIWSDKFFTTFVYETETGRAWRLAETPGGTDFVNLATFELVTDDNVLIAFSGYANWLSLILRTESKSVYLGAEIPQRCVWMADKGLAAEELVGFGEETVAMAALVDALPEEVAGGVSLKIDSLSVAAVVDETSGAEETEMTLEYSFVAVDSSGVSRAVSRLRGGAELWLETADRLSDLGTSRAVRTPLDLASATATVRRTTPAHFARLCVGD